MRNHYLNSILYHKQKYIENLIQHDSPEHSLQKVLDQKKYATSTKFSAALQKTGLAIIAEVKRQSPSCGKINSIIDPIELVTLYCKGGASAISVLTDQEAFGGHLEDLHCISNFLSVSYPSIPTLRKDFILHPLQLAEAVLVGCHAVLLIVSILGKKTKAFIEQAHCLGLETLVEVHNEKELDIALQADAKIIGINHRNLQTFEMDMTLSAKLRPLIPASILTVAESGIHTVEQARYLYELGFHAILVGEALVKSKDPAALINDMRRATSC